MSIKIKRDTLRNLSKINPADYDVIIAIVNDGRNYQVMKNKYIEYNTMDIFHINDLMDYTVECHKVYNEIYGNELPTKGFI